MRNPIATRLHVPCAVNILIEGKACSIIGFCTKDQRPSIKRPASPVPSNSPPKRPRMYSPQSSNSSSVEPNVLPEDPETRILYLRHWNTIQTQENSGNGVQDRHNFTLHEMTASTFPEMVRRIFTQQTTVFTINLSFGLC